MNAVSLSSDIDRFSSFTHVRNLVEFYKPAYLDNGYILSFDFLVQLRQGTRAEIPATYR
jgi:hypothetical protein